MKYNELEAELTAAPAPIQPAPQPDEQDAILREATNLAIALHRKHYATDAPHWEPAPDVLGLLLQIDNMTAGLSRAPQPDADDEAAYRDAPED